MNIKKSQTMDMHLQRIVFYSIYVDCLSRIIREFIENGDDNMLPTDLPNWVELLSKFSSLLRLCISKMNSDWEFME